MFTRSDFLETYRDRLVRSYEWAGIPAKLDRYMLSVEATLAGGTSWNYQGEVVAESWHALGGHGMPTLKALRALPLTLTPTEI